MGTTLKFFKNDKNKTKDPTDKISWTIMEYK
jgi:hypothetical protein